MITPILNINGSSADDLINPRIEAMEHLNNAICALLAATPNGRDYNTGEQCNEDRKKHYDRIQLIDDIRVSIYEEAISIQAQGDRS